MSLFGALNTAVSGLSAQSAAFSNISDNVANSQTVGFKGTDTAFVDYLTTSSANVNDSGAVVARPEYQNDVQGSISTSSDALALAISGQGFFAVNEAAGTNTDGSTALSPTQYYTRTGDFTQTKDGYLVNSAGEYLDGWSVNSTTGAVDQSALSPIKVNSGQFDPVATSKVTLSANLPATPDSTTSSTSQVEVYDSLGTMHALNIGWTQNSSGDWTATITSPDNTTGTTIGTADVKFGPTTSGNNVADGTIGGFGSTTGGVTAGSYSTNGAATLTVAANFGSGTQNISLNLGNFGEANGVTQFAGTDYNLRSLSQDGLAAGSLSGVAIQANGTVVANYDNGQSKTIAQIPIVTFNAPDSLQRQNGEAFTATIDSGDGIAQAVGANQAGSLVVGSVESSNTDIATEFSKLIVAQQAYGANTKIVTTSNDLLQETINMKT